jgi:hypothetical protein
MLSRRNFSCWLSTALAMCVQAAETVRGLRGKLSPGAKPRLIAETGPVALTGDVGTLLVLADERLKGLDFEAVGEAAAGEPDVFRVGPLHKRSMFVHRNGQRLMITYWCEVCSIRTFTPGVCMCCQDETAVDLKEKLESDDLRSR